MIFGLAGVQWLAIAVLLAAGYGLHEILRFVARRILRVRERRTGTKTETGERSIRRGIGLLGLTLPWYLFFDSVGFSPEAGYRVLLAVETVTILGSVLFLYGLWDAVCDTVGQRASGVANAEKLLIPVTRKLVRFLILVAGILLALGVFGVNVTGLLAGVGIGGLVVALAAKDSVENVFGSLTILFDMPFALGDWVKIDKVEGIVEEINLRSTKIRTFEDSMITLPNSNLIKAAVENYGARRYRRQRFLVRISYANKAVRIDRFITAIRKYLAGMDAVVAARTVVELNDMTEASAGVLVQCFFEADSFHQEAKLRGDLMLAIFTAAESTGVIFINTPIPPPQEDREVSKDLERQVIDKEDII